MQTISIISLPLKREHNGHILSCHAENPKIHNSTISEHFVLSVECKKCFSFTWLDFIPDLYTFPYYLRFSIIHTTHIHSLIQYRIYHLIQEYAKTHENTIEYIRSNVFLSVFSPIYLHVSSAIFIEWMNEWLPTNFSLSFFVIFFFFTFFLFFHISATKYYKLMMFWFRPLANVTLLFDWKFLLFIWPGCFIFIQMRPNWNYNLAYQPYCWAPYKKEMIFILIVSWTPIQWQRCLLFGDLTMNYWKADKVTRI